MFHIYTCHVYCFSVSECGPWSRGHSLQPSGWSCTAARGPGHGASFAVPRRGSAGSFKGSFKGSLKGSNPLRDLYRAEALGDHLQ